MDKQDGISGGGGREGLRWFWPGTRGGAGDFPWAGKRIGQGRGGDKKGEARGECGRMGSTPMKTARKRMVLFDIDGTLLDTGGAGRQAFIRGLARVMGARDELAYVSFAGNTDRKVLDQVMAARGQRLEEEEIRRIFGEVAKELRVLLRENPARAVAGAGSFLARLAGAGVALGLVTGNIRECAYLKLGSVGFDRFFRFGGFGDEHAERAEIGRAALAAAAAAGIEGAEGGICLVGDTPFDVAAGVALGIPVIGVAAGKYGACELLAAGAGVVVADFSDAGRLLDWMEATLG
ncbi:MAG: HAD family hydrolase [Opitutae bacterium]|nr:HAD family hydrolase [Opitutae bacterium]